MTFRRRAASLDAVRLVLFALAIAAPLFSQAVAPVRAGLVYHVEGAVVANGSPLDPGSQRFVQLAPGQTLETKRGFAEIALGPDRVLRVAPGSAIELLADDIESAAVRVDRGAVFVDWNEKRKGPKLRIQAGVSAVQVSRAGLYRIDIREGPPRLRVYEGRADLGGGVSLGKGREILLTPKSGAPAGFDGRKRDFFDRWNARRSRAGARMARAGSAKKRDRDPFGRDAPDLDASRRGPGPVFGPGPF